MEENTKSGLERVVDKETGRVKYLPRLLPENVRDLVFEPNKKSTTSLEANEKKTRAESLKVTEMPYMGKPKNYEKDVSNYQIKEDVDKRNLSPYERKAEKFEKRGGGGGGGGIPKSGKHEMLKFSKGGSASSRADGCCIRGKTRA
jgi:hypothetical protein